MIEFCDDLIPLPDPGKTGNPEFWERLNREYVAKMQAKQAVAREREKERLLEMAQNAVEKGTGPPREEAAREIYFILLHRRRIYQLVCDLEYLRAHCPKTANKLLGYGGTNGR